MLDIRLEPELQQRLEAVAAKTGHTASEFVSEAIRERIEDFEDTAAALAVLKNPGRIWTMEEIMSHVDLKADGLEG